MNHFSKPPKTAEEHLALLKERNLSVDESEDIEIVQTIRSIGYFRLSGYFGPLQVVKDKFKDGTKFQDILRLYNFDNELKQLTYCAMTRIEIELRAKMTDVYSLASNSFWYQNEDHFDMKEEKIQIHKCTIEDGVLIERQEIIEVPIYNNLLKEIIQSTAKSEHSDFMTKFRLKYSLDSPIPSWMIVESISFGKLSRLFSLLKPSPERTNIANHFGVFPSQCLVSWLHAFVVLRNICAHHARLWNRKIGKDIMMPKRRNHKFLSCIDEENIRKYYGVSSCMLKVFQSIDKDFMIYYKKRFHSLIKDFEIDIHALGFPDNYLNDDVWNMDGI